MSVFRISKWAETFEQRGDGKTIKGAMTWFSMPASLTSRGRLRLLRHGTDGALALAVFDSIMQMHALLPVERRTGYLVHSDGEPMDAFDIADVIRIDEAIVRKSLELLCDPSVGWLTSSCQEPTGSEIDGEMPENVGCSPDIVGDPQPEEQTPSANGRQRQMPADDGRRDLPADCIQDRTGQDKTGDEKTAPAPVSDSQRTRKPPDRSRSSPSSADPPESEPPRDPATGRAIDGPESRFLAEWDRVLGDTRWRRRYETRMMTEAHRGPFLELVMAYGEPAVLGIPKRILGNEYLREQAKQASMDWALRKSGAVGILDGTYDEHQPTARERPRRRVNP